MNEYWRIFERYLILLIGLGIAIVITNFVGLYGDNIINLIVGCALIIINLYLLLNKELKNLISSKKFIKIYDKYKVVVFIILGIILFTLYFLGIYHISIDFEPIAMIIMSITYIGIGIYGLIRK